MKQPGCCCVCGLYSENVEELAVTENCPPHWYFCQKHLVWMLDVIRGAVKIAQDREWIGLRGLTKDHNK